MVLSKTRMISFEKDFDAEEQDEIRAIDFLQQKFPEKSCYEVWYLKVNKKYPDIELHIGIFLRIFIDAKF